MNFLSFIRENVRWLAGGFLLTLGSSFGQTFFISLSAGEIRSEYGLSHGDFGLLYMISTLASALTLPWLGQVVDRYSARAVATGVIVSLALASLSMALATHVIVLAFTIYCLRLFGQGMMTHTAMTSIGRWFEKGRGRAMSVTVIGHQTGEGVLPIVFVALAALIGWRSSWMVAAVVLIILFLPVVSSLIRIEREPRQKGEDAPLEPVGWTRAQVIRDPLFYPLLMGVMAPGFIGTTIFFHQVYLVELRGWSPEIFALAFSLMAAMTIVFSLISGQLIDRFSAARLLPGFLVPLGLGCLSLALLNDEWAAFIFMGLLGVSYGFSSTLFGAIWPEIYGTRHLGAVRSLVVAVMVFATAAGPGLTGYLIDQGVAYPSQILVMGIYCFAAALFLIPVTNAFRNRALALSAS